MSNGNGKKDDFEGVWALVHMNGGQSIIVRFVPVEVLSEPRKTGKDAIEIVLMNEKWIAVDRAFTLSMIPSMVEGRAALAPVCVPYGCSADEEQKVSIQVPNINTTWFFDDMPKATQLGMKQHVMRALEMTTRVRAASAGIIAR